MCLCVRQPNNMSERIVIVAPSFFGYRDAIASELKGNGYEVLQLETRISDNYFFKILFRTPFLIKIFKRKIRCLFERQLKEILDFNPKKVIYISPEVVSNTNVTCLNSLGIDTILYLWDSLENKPSIEKKLSGFNKVKSFDPVDCEKYNLHYLQLFAENIFENSTEQINRRYDFCAIFTVHSQRIKIIKSLMDDIKNNNLGMNCFLWAYWGNPFYALRSFFYSPKFSISKLKFKSLDKTQCADVFKESKVVLDITHPDQRGLTSRSIEALYSGCVLLTNNSNSIELLSDWAERVIIYEKTPNSKVLQDAIDLYDSLHSKENKKYEKNSLGLSDFTRKLIS